MDFNSSNSFASTSSSSTSFLPSNHAIGMFNPFSKSSANTPLSSQQQFISTQIESEQVISKNNNNLDQSLENNGDTQDEEMEVDDEAGDNSDSEISLDDLEMIKALQKMDQDADSAFAANTRYQSEILAVMKKLAKVTARTSELELIVKDMHLELEIGSEMTLIAPGTSKPTLPWFKHFYGQELPSNPEGEARDLYLNAIRHVPWSSTERTLLRDEVVATNNREVCRLGALKGQEPDEALSEYPKSFYVSCTEYLDWDKIALPFPRRTAMDCKIQWLQVDHPAVNKGKWSSEELDRLYVIVEKKNEKDWVGIATELGTGRNAAECLRRYRGRPGQRRDWTAEEETLLKEGVKMFGMNWQSIAHHVGRSSNQCITKWNKTLKPEIKRGRWTPEEDATLLATVKACGAFWKVVSGRMNGRTDAQCRERWVNKVNPALKPSNVWSAEDDARVYKLKSEGKSWSEIAHTFEGARTDVNCQRRHKHILKQRQKPPSFAERKLIREAKLKAIAEAGGEANGADGEGDAFVDEDEDQDEEEEEAERARAEAAKPKRKAPRIRNQSIDNLVDESVPQDKVIDDSGPPVAGPSRAGPSRGRPPKKAKLSK